MCKFIRKNHKKPKILKMVPVSLLKKVESRGKTLTKNRRSSYLVKWPSMTKEVYFNHFSCLATGYQIKVASMASPMRGNARQRSIFCTTMLLSFLFLSSFFLERDRRVEKVDNIAVQKVLLCN